MRHPIRLALVAAASACILASGAASAQGTPENIAKPSCKRPEYPGKNASADAKKTFNNDVEAFAGCIKQYVSERQRAADEHIKAANAAAADYNNAVKEIQAAIDKDKQ